MPILTLADIRPGLVAYLDQPTLEQDKRVRKTSPQKQARAGPFLCVESDSQGSTWTPVTTKPGKDEIRVTLYPEWRSGGPEIWRESESFLNDGANLYRGPNEAFLAARRETFGGRVWVDAASHATLSRDGLKVVLDEIENCSGDQQIPL
ncbi:MAG: hypothetical protein K8T90_09090 [Planctomycetes bacterium]|nr:hypothetical protein [Planctomycetota bacterium]